jgi:hypothetical protein
LVFRVYMVPCLSLDCTPICVTHVYVNRNITFSLPAELVRQAKIYAAEHETTVNSLVRELLQDKLHRDGRIQVASQRLLELAERGPYFTVEPSSITREELYERR